MYNASKKVYFSMIINPDVPMVRIKTINPNQVIKGFILFGKFIALKLEKKTKYTD